MSLRSRFFSMLFVYFREGYARLLQGYPSGRFIFNVERYGTVELPGSPIENNGENAVRLQDFLSQNGFTAKKANAVLGQSGIITRNVIVPEMAPGDLEKAMKLNITDYLPVSPDEYATDFKVVDGSEEKGENRLEVTVAAVKRKHTEYYASILEGAGLKPLVFDILPNALLRLLSHSAGKEMMVIDGGNDGTRLAIIKSRSLFMYADVPFAAGPGTVDDLSVLTGEIRGYMDFYSSRNFGKTLDEIILLGDLAGIENVTEILAQNPGLRVTPGVREEMPFVKSETGFAQQFHLYAPNCGLVLRGYNGERGRMIKENQIFQMDDISHGA